MNCQLHLNKLYLVIDVSTTCAIIGLLMNKEWLAYKEQTNLNPTALAGWVQELLKCNKQSIQSLDAVIYSEGPGSTLGVRTSQIFIHTLCLLNPHLQRYPYNSMLAASFTISQNQYHLISPGPNASFYELTYDKGALLQTSINKLSTNLFTYPIYYLPLRKTHPFLQENANALNYSFHKNASIFYRPDIYEPIIYNRSEFKKWH